MHIYNTLSRRKEEFVPAREGRINIYVCGITAYDYCHIGHARSAVVFDVLVRYLRHLKYKVTFVRNFTDVDDKIIGKSRQEGIPSAAIAEKYILAFHEDMDRLGVLRADLEPKATDHIEDMTKLCQKLIQKGHAYATPSGDVYFRVRSFDGYGKLSGRGPDEMLSGARVAPGEDKEDPLDFALWKAAKADEPYWESPWGPGRPGWHIECSAMSEKYLSLPLDIHGGGQDLIFPHHENEIAQSEAALDLKFCRYWLHNGFVQVNGEKMAKSRGNFTTIREILTSYLPEVLRFFLLTRQYRSPVDFSFQAMEEAEKNLKRLYQDLDAITTALQKDKWRATPDAPCMLEELRQISASLDSSMADDLNTAATLGHINNLLRLTGRVLETEGLNKSESARDLLRQAEILLKMWGEVLGLFNQKPQDFLRDLKLLQARRKHINLEDIEALMAVRQTARKTKDFARSDAIRAELAALGVELRDTPHGTVWDLL
jgi:cysteinyl-tRNA synthetase